MGDSLEQFLVNLTLAAAQRQLAELDRYDVSPYHRALTRFVVWGFCFLQ